MRRRPLALAALLLAATPLTGAHASGTKPSCPSQVTDPRGDAVDWMLPNHPPLPEGDVLGLTVQSRKTTLAFTWHMAAVSATPTRAIQLVAIIKVNQGGYYSVSIDHAADGNDFQDAQWDNANHVDDQGSIHDIAGSMDTGAGTLTALVPAADLHVSRGSAIYDFRGFVGEDAGTSAAGVGKDVDDFGSSKTYFVGRRHC